MITARRFIGPVLYFISRHAGLAALGSFAGAWSNPAALAFISSAARPAITVGRFGVAPIKLLAVRQLRPEAVRLLPASADPLRC